MPRSQAHNEYVMAEKKREEWELKNHREGEILEMVEIFEVCSREYGIRTERESLLMTCELSFDGFAPRRVCVEVRIVPYACYSVSCSCFKLQSQRSRFDLNSSQDLLCFR